MVNLPGHQVSADPSGLEEIPRTSDEFGAWIAPHLRVLSALAVRQVGADEALDVVQETLVRAWRRRETFRHERGTVRAWLVAILLDQGRRHRIRHPRILSAMTGRVDHEIAGPTGDRVDVARAVAGLAKRQRQVVTLYYLADLSVAEIAVVMSISQSSVTSHLSAGRAALRAALELQ